MLADDLGALFLFEALTDAQLAELMAAGEEIRFEAGQELFQESAPADHWWVLLEGQVELVRHAGREESVLRMMEVPGQWAGGFRAWDDTTGYLATFRGASTGRVFRVPAPALGALAREWFPFGVHLIEGFFQTVRSMDSLSRQRASLVALGTLAAGLAHELNNPASAATRAVDAMRATSTELLQALADLAERSLTAEQFVAIEALRQEIDPSAADADPVAVADREDVLSAWLDEHDVENAWRIAPSLAAAGVDVAWCDRMADVLGDDVLGPGLEWVAGTLTTASLLTEMKEATERVSSLVAAVKSYSQMDRASRQHIAVTDGIESTLVMLSYKLGGVTVEREYAANAPLIEAEAGSLNQVWTNLIDNAIDAMEGSGTLRIVTRVEPEHLVVEVIDTGSGMPAGVKARAFEPFFTTKDIGKGTGLGLDISRQIVVERHHGEIDIESVPGNTVLRVRLPLRQQ
jgi:signal transduction histidine kinase